MIIRFFKKAQSIDMILDNAHTGAITRVQFSGDEGPAVVVWKDAHTHQPIMVEFNAIDFGDVRFELCENEETASFAFEVIG